MKTIFALATALFVGTAFAQTDSMGSAPRPVEGEPRHLLSFHTDGSLLGKLSFEKTKVRGQESDNDTNLDLAVNYAYLIHRNLHVGAKFNYSNGVGANFIDQERYGLAVGGIWNFWPEDIMNSLYGSVFVGYDKIHNFSNQLGKDEVFGATVAIGKRFDMKRWGMSHVVYSPEIAYVGENGTTDRSFDYRGSLQVRYLQFSVLF